MRTVMFAVQYGRLLARSKVIFHQQNNILSFILIKQTFYEKLKKIFFSSSCKKIYIYRQRTNKNHLVSYLVVSAK